MPTCPGCQQQVSHERLGDHVEHCGAVVGDEARDRDSVDRLARRVDRLERRLRMQDIRIERALGGNPTGPGDDEDLPPLRR